MHDSSAAPELADRIDALLPQTQCTRCGYPACRPYAEAIARGATGINHCPPGGAAGIGVLADLLGRPVIPLDPVNGIEKPRELALIDEEVCIGCTKCILACPVDAILGASKMMHTVLVEECTGCELCIAPCPVDCITMVVAAADGEDSRQRAARYRKRYDARATRLALDEEQRAVELATRKAALGDGVGGNAVLAAIQRARARKSGARSP